MTDFLLFKVFFPLAILMGLHSMLSWTMDTTFYTGEINPKKMIMLKKHDIIGGIRSILISLFIDSFVQRN